MEEYITAIIILALMWTIRNSRKFSRLSSLFLIITSLLFLTINAVISQTPILDRKVRFTEQTTTVEDLLYELSKAGYFSFSYGRDVPLDKQIQVTDKSQSIRTHLYEIFNGDSLMFVEKGRKILIIPDQPETRKAFPNQTQAEKATLTGTISDSKGNPLMYASVFISNTTRGTTTNERGEYRLINVPLGYHKLMASYIGYETKMIPLEVNRASITQNIRLNEQTLEIDEVTIQSEKGKNKWNQYYKKFEKSFIGKSDNAPSCKIINPKALLFHYDKETRILTANARESLVIENHGLGYTVRYELEKFELQRDGSCNYLGSAHFTPMRAENKSIEEFWKINRKRAYKGSIQHLLRAMTNNSLVKEGFVAQSCKSISPVEIKKEVDFIINHHGNALGSEIDISIGRYYFERKLDFKNFLHVVFTKEYESHAYGATMHPRYRLKPFQQSWIALNTDGALFNTLGYLNDPESVIVYGYWAFERQSESLPNDYYPKN